ncbi:interferon alpha-inducible protein 27-like protein 2 [Pecten maximus]|uniref:interferon alpha-inducible protein 27-like protein 2 n=1 Tax=Pecten maximus TaxID=6579 RepID=UPI0014586AB6|nr:interferon alpha-inducible protein 27-like protein 2 [Pecten maximus]XP_033735971.1 interferon alpha-inducible protein 27-like protein 2 [Pecten maximus]
MNDDEKRKLGWKSKEKTYKLSELKRAQVDLQGRPTDSDSSDSEEEEQYAVNSPSQPVPRKPTRSRKPSKKSGSLLAKIGLSVLGGVVAVAATPVLLGAVGFSAGGIVAGSLAAKAMSVAAIANGGGVAAGSVVAVCQSVGAAGLGLTGAATVGTTAVGVTYGGITVAEKLTKQD